MDDDDHDPLTVLFLPDFRGGNPYLSNLASALNDRGVTVAFSDATRLPRIWRAVRDVGDVDVVHLHWLSPYIRGTTLARTLFMSLLAVLQLAVLRLSGVSVVWTVHNLTPHESAYPRVHRRTVGLVVRACDRFLVHCEAVGTELAERYGGERTRRRTKVVPHGHFNDNYENVVSREEARDRLALDTAGTVFLYFGNIRQYKGILRLIDAFMAVAAENSRLLIVGSPHDREYATEVAQKASESTRIRTVIEFVPDDEVQVYMNAADAVVLPYREIATSGAAVLAMSFGKAVITASTGCNPELIGDRGGLLYGNGETLRTALRDAEDADLRALGDRNRRTVSDYDWNGIAEDTEAVYRECR